MVKLGMRIALQCCLGNGWGRTMCVSMIVCALLPTLAVAHERASLAWVWSAVEANDNSVLIDFLERNNGRVVDLLIEVSGGSGTGPLALYDGCVSGGVEGAPVTALPLAAFEISGDDTFDCGSVVLRIDGEDHVSRYQSYYPTYLSQVISGSFRVIRLEEWGDAASQTVVFVIDGVAP